MAKHGLVGRLLLAGRYHDVQSAQPRQGHWPQVHAAAHIERPRSRELAVARRDDFKRGMQAGAAYAAAASQGHGDRSSRAGRAGGSRSEEHTSELQSLMRISYAVFCLKKKKMINVNIRETI